MADQVFYTKKRTVQFRGPTTSDDYNARIEENYKDLTVLANRQQTLIEELEYLKRYLVKNFTFFSSAMSNMFDQLNLDVGGAKPFVNTVNIHEDNERFDGTAFEINSVDRLQFDNKYRVFTLPRIESGSFSKLKYTSLTGQEIVSPNFKVFIQPIGDVEQQSSNFVDANDFYNALISKTTHRGWELNSIVDSSYEGTSAFRVYVTIPEDQSLARDSNVILYDPLYPGKIDLKDFKYSTSRNITFTDSDNWQEFNVQQYPIDIFNQWVLPSGEDVTIPRSLSGYFSFPPKPITAVSFVVETQQHDDDEQYNVYSHGLHGFDIRYEKFADEGRTILRIDAIDNAIDNIESVIPILANCSSSEAPFAFSYRTIWETSYDSGIYTLEPVPTSSRVWLEITMRKTVDGGAPILPLLLVETS